MSLLTFQRSWVISHYADIHEYPMTMLTATEVTKFGRGGFKLSTCVSPGGTLPVYMHNQNDTKEQKKLIIMN